MQFFNRVGDIFELLNESCNTDRRHSDEKAMEVVNRWAEVKPEHQHIPDYYFLLNVCYGPWVEKRQKGVWTKAYTRFKEVCDGDLRQVSDTEDLGLPFRWQVQHIHKVAAFLRAKGFSFREFLDSLQGKTGLQVIDEFRGILGTKSTKIVSTFTGDYLKLEVFPIDSRVDAMLSYLGLPRDEDMVVKLCRAHAVNPNVLNRMLYDYYGDKCSKKSKKLCDQCFIKEYCYYGYLA